MPLKDIVAYREYQRKYRAKRRLADEDFRKKEIFMGKEWEKRKYASDPVYKRQRNFKRVVVKYGLTMAEYETKLREQNYKCAICGKPHVDENGGRLHIDHDHFHRMNDKDGVRGLLCTKCNCAIGLLDESEEKIVSALEYLRRYKK